MYFHFTVLSCFMSAAFVSKSGSLELRQPSKRCGLSPCLAQMRVMVTCEISRPSSAASLLEDQCVDPSNGLCFVVHANILASMRLVTL